MNVVESRRVRHLVLRLDRGEELPVAIQRALDEVEARSAFFTGTGTLESAELSLFDQRTRDYGRPRRIDSPTTVVSLTGNVASLDGVTIARVSATLARETDAGLTLVAGELVGGRVYALELHVTAFDDLSLARVADDRTGLPVLAVRPSTVLGAGSPPAPTPAAERAHAPVAAPAHEPTGRTETNSASSPALPTRQKPPAEQHVEHYPEPGDSVVHFHFGECTVIDSDGDRIRLRQDKDGRVREVALTMLRIEGPTTDAAGKRKFLLSRKN